MTKLIPTYKMEPGDGTGCSIKDAIARNDLGACGMYNCGNTITDNAKSYPLVQCLCLQCEKSYTEALAKIQKDIVDRLETEWLKGIIG